MIIDLLEPKNPENFKINWVVHEYVGCEIILASDITMFMHDPDRHKFRIRERSGINEGDAVVVWPGYECNSYATVGRSGDSWMAFIGEHLNYLLEFDCDDRHCWVSTVACNFKALERVSFA